MGIRRAFGPTARWLIVLGVVLVAVLIGSGPARARTVSGPNITPCTWLQCFNPTTTTTTVPYVPPPPPPPPPPSTTTTAPSTTTTTTTTSTPVSVPPGSGYSAAFLPCGSTTGACNQAPKQVELTYPLADTAPNLEIEWVKGPAAAAPQPASPTVTLDQANAGACPSGTTAPTGEAVKCWAWPAGLTDRSFILNGTYKLTPSGQKATDVALAVPPAAPRQVVATAVSDSVAVSWQPSAAPEPDLTGYVVTRNSQPVYYCSVDGLGPGANTPCAKPLTVTDHPGAGKWTYAASALRLGVDQASADAVGSPLVAAAPGAVTLTAPATAPSPLSSIGLAPLPASTGATYGDATGTASAADPAALGGGDTGPAPETAPVQNIKYPGADSPVVGKPSELALNVGEPGAHPDVVPVAVLALGIIALAVAAHFLYLRVELGLAEARLASRRRRRD